MWTLLSPAWSQIEFFRMARCTGNVGTRNSLDIYPYYIIFLMLSVFNETDEILAFIMAYVMSLVNNCWLYVRGLCLPHWYRWSRPECYAVQLHIIFIVNEHEVWWSMKNLKIHVFILFKLKVASTLSCSRLYRSYNSVASLQHSYYTYVGGWPKIFAMYLGRRRLRSEHGNRLYCYSWFFPVFPECSSHFKRRKNRFIRPPCQLIIPNIISILVIKRMWFGKGRQMN
jgi:hypothetical protein